MQADDPFGPAGGPVRRPWFVTRQFGFGYRPQTWQGVVVMAVLVLPVVILAAVYKPHTPVYLLALVPAVVVPYIIRTVQRRGGRG
jgi:hypothetical protein